MPPPPGFRHRDQMKWAGEEEPRAKWEGPRGAEARPGQPSSSSQGQLRHAGTCGRLARSSLHSPGLEAGPRPMSSNLGRELLRVPPLEPDGPMGEGAAERARGVFPPTALASRRRDAQPE